MDEAGLSELRRKLGLDGSVSWLQPWALFVIGASVGVVLNGVGALPYEFVVAAFVVGWSVGWLGAQGGGGGRLGAVPVGARHGGRIVLLPGLRCELAGWAAERSGRVSDVCRTT